ncbi:MAG: DUF2924 domain-containing protein [Lysobacteraceae bacterium]
MTVTGEVLLLGGHRYHSLRPVGKAITGNHWNGFLFFRLGGAAASSRIQGQERLHQPPQPRERDARTRRG